MANDGADDDTAIQAALDAAAGAGGGTVVIPCGTFHSSPVLGAPRLSVGSSTVVAGEGPCSVLKVRDNAGDYRSLFGQGGFFVKNVVFRDLRIDQNATGNQTCDVRIGGQRPQFVFDFVQVDGLLIERVIVDEASGVNTVFANGVRVTNVQVVDSRFRFVAARTLDASGTYDNSAIYLHGRDWLVSRNIFENASTPGHARTAIEVHGSRGSIVGNLSRGYAAGIHVVGESPTDPPGAISNAVTVTGNTVYGANRGINLWALTGRGLRGVSVIGNTITLDLAAHSAISHAGISFVRDSVSGQINGDIEDVVISGNTISMSPWESGAYADADSAGILLYPHGNVRNLVVTSNVVRNAPGRGIHLQAGGEVNGALIANNIVIDAGNDSRARTRAALVLAGTVKATQVIDNSVIDTGRSLHGQASLHLSGLQLSSRAEIRDNLVTDADPKADLVPATSQAAWGDLSTAPWSTLAYGPRIQPRADAGRRLAIAVTDDAPHRLEAPERGLAGQRLRIHFKNTSIGAAGALTWGAGVRAGPWSHARPGHGRIIELEFDGNVWFETWRSTADVPN
jgi:hypothetical protein